MTAVWLAGGVFVPVNPRFPGRKSLGCSTQPIPLRSSAPTV